MNLAGMPAQISLSGILLVTTEPAPITERDPTVTPFYILHSAPIKQFFFIRTGAEGTCELPFNLYSAITEW